VIAHDVPTEPMRRRQIDLGRVLAGAGMVRACAGGLALRMAMRPTLPGAAARLRQGQRAPSLDPVQPAKALTIQGLLWSSPLTMQPDGRARPAAKAGVGRSRQILSPIAD
jgi:hypothetical protein